LVLDDTIAAIATPVGEGAIALIRISGPASWSVVRQMFHSGQAAIRPRHAIFGELRNAQGDRLDFGLATFFQAPHSYTGQDLVEIGCHGGILVVRRVLEQLLALGARMAEPGEFTQRAFLNHKLDLTQAEAVMDLIRAQTDLALRAANEQLAGGLGGELKTVQEELLQTLAHLEAYIDFPDEDIDPETGGQLIARLQHLAGTLNRLLASAETGRMLRHGVRTVIYGEPNVGKSSLLNVLLGYERAIVSTIAGTTRDTIEETINLRGLPLRLVDTAGDREVSDSVELEGIRRTHRELENADLILHVVDASQPKRLPPLDDRRALVVLNKVDLGLHPDWVKQSGVHFSCLSGFGQSDLENAIWELITRESGITSDFRIAINTRHQNCLTQARQAIAAAIVGLEEQKLIELVAIDVRTALNHVGEVVGKTDTDDLLDRIFSQFCIGK
jgi:tRNA modification GTPase